MRVQEIRAPSKKPLFKKHYAKKVSLFSDECRADLNGGKKSVSENELGRLKYNLFKRVKKKSIPCWAFLT